MSRATLAASTSFLAAVLSLARPGVAADLRPECLQAFDAHIRAAEARMAERLESRKFLWTDDDARRSQALHAGQVLVDTAAGRAEIPVAHGLVHDWIGAVFIPGVTLGGVLSAVQDYDNHKLAYRPEVIDSKLLGRNGNDFHVYLRLKKKKVITVTLNTEHDVRYFPLDDTRCHSRSYSTRIAEVANAGKSDESEMPAGKDHGFLWRLYSYWRFAERDGGVYVECEAISLTRDVPTGLGWLISPIIRNLPRESLIATLTSTRTAARSVSAK